MYVYTPNRKITNLTASVIDTAINTVKSVGSNVDYGTALWRRRLTFTASWKQLEFTTFVEQINRGLLMPLWVRTSTIGSENLTQSNRDMTAMVLRPLWLGDSIIQVQANTPYKLLDITSATDTFPVQATMGLPTYYNGAHRAEYELVGAVGWSVQTALALEFLDNFQDKGCEYILGDIPWNEEMYVDKTHKAFFSGVEVMHEDIERLDENGEIAYFKEGVDDAAQEIVESNMIEWDIYYKSLLRKAFDENKSPDGYLHNPFFIINHTAEEIRLAGPNFFDHTGDEPYAPMELHFDHLGGFLRFDPADFLDKTRVMSCHATDNVLHDFVKMHFQGQLTDSQQGTWDNLQLVMSSDHQQSLADDTIFTRYSLVYGYNLEYGTYGPTADYIYQRNKGANYSVELDQWFDGDGLPLSPENFHPAEYDSDPFWARGCVNFNCIRTAMSRGYQELKQGLARNLTNHGITPDYDPPIIVAAYPPIAAQI